MSYAHVSPGKWNGDTVQVESDAPCPVEGHELKPWIRTDGLDTFLLWCDRCNGVAGVPGMADCGIESDNGWCDLAPDHAGPHHFVEYED